MPYYISDEHKGIHENESQKDRMTLSAHYVKFALFYYTDSKISIAKLHWEI